MIFFFLASLVSIATVYFESNRSWYNSEQTRLGLFFNEHNKDKSSKVLFDEDNCGKISKDKQDDICSDTRFYTISGFWMNSDIRIGNTRNIEGIGYIVSKKELGYEKIYGTKKGIFLSFQTPVEIHGTSFSGFLRNSYNSLKKKKISFLEFQNLLLEKAIDLGIDKKNVEGYINHGFSGGEKKKSEVLQAMVLSPRFIMFDEIDSGLDVDSLRKVSNEIKKLATGEKTVLIITHY